MEFLRKTLGGLKGSYYIRHFILGVLISAAFIYLTLGNANGIKHENIIFSVFNAFLYPYARFVYEQIVEFIIGENILFINAILILPTKIATMIICWGLSIFIAPIGLAYLYYHHSKTDSI